MLELDDMLDELLETPLDIPPECIPPELLPDDPAREDCPCPNTAA
jgi:hypothetical protein